MVEVLRKVGNGLVVALILTLFAGGVLTVAFQFPRVQTWATHKAVRVLSDRMGYPILVSKINVRWFDVVVLEGVSVRDPDREPMIDVARIDVNFDFSAMLRNSGREIHLDDVNLYRPEVRMTKNAAGSTNMDLFIARINEMVNSGDTSGYVPDRHKPFTIGRAKLVDGSFHFQDPRKPMMPGSRVFDYYHFTLHDISADLADFRVLGDTITFQANDLTAIDGQTSLKIHDLDTRFLYCAKKMELADLQAYIGGSYLTNYLSFRYDHPSDFGDFNEKVRMVARFRDSRVYSKDLGLFHEYLHTLRETWYLTGRFNGTVRDFRVTGTTLRFGNGSRLAGDFGFRGLPQFHSTTMDFRLAGSRVDTRDLVQYYPRTDLHQTFQKFGTVALDGTFKGTSRDFALKSDVDTDIGGIKTDLFFQIRDRTTSTYKGFLSTRALDLGTLFDQSAKFQLLDFSGKITGRGFTIASASANLDATVKRLGFRDYDYQNLQLRGNLQKAYFDGQVSSRDPNLSFILDGEIDLSQPVNRFDLQGVLINASFKELGFTSEPLTLTTRIDAQVAGNSLDELVGQASFIGTSLRTPNNRRALEVESLRLRSDQLANERSIHVDSDILSARLSGDFVLSETANDLAVLLKEYKLYFKGNAMERSTYYAGKPVEVAPRRYTINYQIEGRDVSPLTAFLLPDVTLSTGSRLEGVLRMGNTAFLTFNARADTLKVGNTRFVDSELDVTTSKFVNNAEVLASALVTSRDQRIQNLASTERLSVEATWEQDHIQFVGELHQSGNDNRANLTGTVDFVPSGLYMKLTQSDLRVMDEVWTVNPNNLVSVIDREVTFENLALTNGTQRVSLDGEIAGEANRNLTFELKDIQLAVLNPILETKLSGVMNGAAILRDREESSEISSYFRVQGLTYNNYLLGNMGGRGEWDQQIEQFRVEAHLDRELARVFSLNGTYSPDKKEEALNMRALFDNAELSMIEPFSRDLISNVAGRVSGTLSVGGTPNYPLVNGELAVERGSLRFDYLNSQLYFDDRVRFGANSISTEGLTVRDSDGNTALVRGGVSHDGFRKFRLDFDADMQGFKILSTTARDNDLFFGTAFVTGNARLFGPLNNITIEAAVTSDKGTRMYIPLDGPTKVATQDYIQFVSQLAHEDSLQAAGGERPTRQVGGIKMDFNLNITPDAYCEIQLDRQAGDIIKAYGSGLINLKVDTKGDFTMNGNYEIQQGDYTFTFQNALNKKFTINPGSRITWSGDPYEALLDVEAAYTQMASLNVLPELSTLSRTNNNSELLRRYPVEVTISLTDRLMTPTIGYSLAVTQYPSSGEFRSAVAAFENRLRSNEQELSRQVSSLLLFNQLISPQEGLLGEVNQSATFLENSISELVSNQISRWASALDENLEVGVSGLSLDQSTLNNLQLRLSYRFLNDRFRITRDGRFTYGTNQVGASQFNATSLLGEWTLEYWLAQNGSVRLKAYNRNIQNALLLNNAITTGGVSMQFTHSFNRFRLLDKERPGEPSTPPDSSAVPGAKLTSKLEESYE